MKFNELKKNFDEQILKPMTEGKEIPKTTIELWLLIFLFEIHGDLDSLSASVYKLEKDYSEMLELTKERMNGR